MTNTTISSGLNNYFQPEVLRGTIGDALGARHSQARENLRWLFDHLHPYFFITMKEETEAIQNLALGLASVVQNRKLTLTEQDKKLIVARLDLPGSVYDTLIPLREKEISYAEMIHSDSPIPGSDRELEIHRFDFDRRSNEEIKGATGSVPAAIRRAVRGEMKNHFPHFDLRRFDEIIRLLWLNNEEYIRISPPLRIARNMWLYQQGIEHDGLFLDAQEMEVSGLYQETRVLFAVVNPPQRAFFTQVLEVFKRLKIGVRRYYVLNISTGLHPYFLGTFYVTAPERKPLSKESDLLRQLQAELYNTQILSPYSSAYTDFVTAGLITGEEASLVNAFAGFCHTTLAHSHPDRFSYDVVRKVFLSDPAMTLKLVGLFKRRFDPQRQGDDQEGATREMEQMIGAYNTGHRYLDEIRRIIYHTCLTFITHTLKTNFYVLEKHALSFRLDPAYLSRLSPEFTADLPSATPFRITFFFGRYGLGYHIGFSDIARGGWRTIICKNQDEYTTNMNNLFREVFVLAHTQHLKNKDIYEGGSKMTVVLDAINLDGPEEIKQRLYKMQYGFINAFFDIFVTERGKAKNSRIVDYYGQEEPIEIGPDENLHDDMIELIAAQSVKRGYILGIGVISSKKVGINHKQYGVTSRGVVKYAEIALEEAGIRLDSQPFTVRFTGGPNGDVAGNSLRLLLERYPLVAINAIVDGSGGLYDPEGADRRELERIVLHDDICAFNPEALHPGGFIVYRNLRRLSGLRNMHRKVIRLSEGIQEEWLTSDDFHRELDYLTFSVPADLFLPCGGRPETIDGTNWERLLDENGEPLVKIIVEGANSFIAPTARDELQRRGIIVIRDASANKCGVISSSYEILANLLLTEKEFLTNKEAYVNDVLMILEKMAAREAHLLFKRHREQGGKVSYTQITSAISEETNDHYGRLFAYFQSRPELLEERLFQRVILTHLPPFISKNALYRRRVNRLPLKIRCAILATEIASTIVYRGGWETDLSGRLRAYLKDNWR